MLVNYRLFVNSGAIWAPSRMGHTSIEKLLGTLAEKQKKTSTEIEATVNLEEDSRQVSRWRAPEGMHPKFAALALGLLS